MTVISLVTAVALGIVIGGACRMFTARRQAPLWLPVTAAVGAAVLGTVIVRLAGNDAAGTSAVELAVQAAFAVMGAAIVTVTADHRPVDRSERRAKPLP
jgi:hypothetical protein